MAASQTQSFDSGMAVWHRKEFALGREEGGKQTKDRRNKRDRANRRHQEGFAPRRKEKKLRKKQKENGRSQKNVSTSQTQSLDSGLAIWHREGLAPKREGGRNQTTDKRNTIQEKISQATKRVCP